MRLSGTRPRSATSTRANEAQRGRTPPLVGGARYGARATRGRDGRRGSRRAEPRLPTGRSGGAGPRPATTSSGAARTARPNRTAQFHAPLTRGAPGGRGSRLGVKREAPSAEQADHRLSRGTHLDLVRAPFEHSYRAKSSRQRAAGRRWRGPRWPVPEDLRPGPVLDADARPHSNPHSSAAQLGHKLRGPEEIHGCDPQWACAATRRRQRGRRSGHDQVVVGLGALPLLVWLSSG